MIKTTGDNYIFSLYCDIYLLFASWLNTHTATKKIYLHPFIMSFHYSKMYKSHFWKEPWWLFCTQSQISRRRHSFSGEYISSLDTARNNLKKKSSCLGAKTTWPKSINFHLPHKLDDIQKHFNFIHKFTKTCKSKLSTLHTMKVTFYYTFHFFSNWKTGEIFDRLCYKK